MRVWILGALLSLPAMGLPQAPVGNCTDPGFMAQMNSWCSAVRRQPKPKQYHCLSNDTNIDVWEHNYRVDLRIMGPAQVSCARLCGADPYKSWIYPYYQQDSAQQSYDLVDSLIVCRCPNIVYGSAPPSRSRYVAKLRVRDRANWDRSCSGRGRLPVKVHNQRISGARCFTRGSGLRMVCPVGQIDYCSKHPSPVAIGVSPSRWKHHCVSSQRR